jgi:hypothetical protein
MSISFANGIIKMAHCKNHENNENLLDLPYLIWTSSFHPFLLAHIFQIHACVVFVKGLP